METKKSRFGSSIPVRIPIRVKITLPYFLLGLFLILASSYLITQIVFDTIEERFNNQIIEAGKLASEWMVREENTRLEALRQIAYTEGVFEAIQANDVETLRSLVMPIILNRQEKEIELLDADGDLILSIHHQTGGALEAYTFTTTTGIEFKNWEFIQNTLSGQSDSLGDKYAGLIFTNQEYHFYVSGPIYNQNHRLAGAVLVGKPVATIVEEMAAETGGRITLYDLSGNTLASTLFEQPALTPEQAEIILARQDNQALVRPVISPEGQFIQEAARSDAHIRELSISTLNYSEFLRPWEVRDQADLGILGVSLFRSTWVSASLPTRVQVFFLVALAFALVIFIGVTIARYITTPLLTLVEASAKVAEGNLSIQVPVNTGDEVSVLATHFNQMVNNLRHSHAQLIEAYDTTLEGWAKAVSLREEGTGSHTRRVTDLTVDLARGLHIAEENIPDIRRGAILHDIGKIGIADAVLKKPGDLNESEWELMRKHPEYAVEMLSEIDFLKPALDIPLYHHEKWDGSGYPFGLIGEKIPLPARIFAVVDVWDAITSKRPYRDPLSKEEALEVIRSGSGTHFDPEIVTAFITLITEAHNEHIIDQPRICENEADLAEDFRVSEFEVLASAIKEGI